MLGALVSTVLKARLALGAVGMAFPGVPRLKLRFRPALLGIMAAVAGGVLSACAVATMIFGLGYSLYLYAGFSPLQAGAVTVSVTVFATVLLFYYGREKLKEALDIREDFSSNPLQELTVTKEHIVLEALDGFLRGLLGSGAATRRKRPTAASFPRSEGSARPLLSFIPL